MIVLGLIFRCLEPMIILGAAGTYCILFAWPLESRDESDKARLAFAENSGSDHIAILNAFHAVRSVITRQGYGAARAFAEQKFIRYSVFRNMEATVHEVEKVLFDAGLVPPSAPSDRYRGNNQLGGATLNENSANLPLIKALLTSASSPNIAIAKSPRSLRTSTDDSLPSLIHPSSVKKYGRDCKLTRGDLFTYSSLLKSNDGNILLLKDVSEITPLTAALFGGHFSRKAGNPSWANHILQLDNWLRLCVRGEPEDATELLVKFRAALDQLLSATFRDLAKVPRRRRRWHIGDHDEEEVIAEETREDFVDDPRRTVFVNGLVELLELDAAAWEERKEEQRREREREREQREQGWKERRREQQDSAQKASAEAKLTLPEAILRELQARRRVSRSSSTL
jgi:ATP-dependent RNA helicase DHX36